MRGSSQSVLSPVEKTSKSILKILTNPKLKPKKCVVHRYHNCIDTLCQNCMVWLWDGYLCYQKANKYFFFKCSGFQKFNFSCLPIKLLIYLPKSESHIELSVSFVGSWFQGLKYIAPSISEIPLLVQLGWGGGQGIVDIVIIEANLHSRWLTLHSKHVSTLSDIQTTTH